MSDPIRLGRLLAARMGHFHLPLESVVCSATYWRDNKETPEGLKMRKEMEQIAGQPPKSVVA